MGNTLLYAGGQVEHEAIPFSGAHGDSYAFDVRGKTDNYGKDRSKYVTQVNDIAAVFDSLMICMHSKPAFQKEYIEMAKLYTSITGIETSDEDIKHAGERISNLERLINFRIGMNRKDDTLPWKVMHEPIPDEGPTKGAVITQKDLDALLDDYYAVRGWSINGVPTTAKLQELGLEEYSKIAEDEKEV